VTGLRERKKRATRAAIHHAALELFAAQGFAGTTIDEIAAAADVSRATVFTYFPTKEDIVFGEAPQAVAELGVALRDADGSSLPVVREWLRQLTGWIEPALLLQLRLAREVPGVAARRLRIFREIEAAVADALERELGESEHLAARLAAASLIAALGVAEEAAAARMEETGRPLAEAEVDRLLDDAVAFADAGMAALRAR
jgi:AcrR family transcriptional regulator